MIAARSSLLTTMLAVTLSAIAAPPRSASPRELGVDLVALQDGPRLRGGVLAHERDGSIRMVVGREWLKSQFPEFYKQEVVKESEQRTDALQKRLNSINAWEADLAPGRHKTLRELLVAEQDRLTKSCAELQQKPTGYETQFLLIERTGDEVRHVLRQTRENQRVALFAWSNHLKDVETRSVRDLGRELAKRGIDPAKQTIDLTDRLPAGDFDEQEWAARKALVDYALRKPLDFQGTGGALFRTDEAAKPVDATELLSKMLSSELTQTLNELLEPNDGGRPASDPLRNAQKIADREKIDGMRVTTFEQNLSEGRVTVQTEFLARTPDGKWRSIWRHTETADATKKRPELEARIADDPQVKSIVGVVGKLGLPGGDSAATNAVRAGAAVHEALERANERFNEFRNANVGSLNGPLVVPKLTR